MISREEIADDIFGLAEHIRRRYSEVSMTDALRMATDIVLTDLAMPLEDMPDEDAPSPFDTFGDDT
jgi:hypothetical protein